MVWLMREFMMVAKALADQNRVRALMLLRAGELCVCQIIEVLGLAPSTVSKHMSILHQARLVETRKEGRWMYYRLAGVKAAPLVRETIDWVAGTLAGSPLIKRDDKRLRQVLKIDRQVLCKKQMKK